MIAPDQTPHPTLYEVKKVYQNIKVHPVDMRAGKVRIENKYFFTSLGEFEGAWELKENGRVVQKGKLGRLNVAPRTTSELTLPAWAEPRDANADLLVTISFALAEDRRWAKEGHVVARINSRSTPLYLALHFTILHLYRTSPLWKEPRARISASGLVDEVVPLRATSCVGRN